MSEVEKVVKEDKTKNIGFFVSRKHAGLTVQVQKLVKNADGTTRQEVDEQATFTQYYDTYKGDVIRVGYLATTSAKIAAACAADENVEQIDEKEYNKAIEELRLAPVPAA